jgi:type I restriction enzyme M protein
MEGGQKGGEFYTPKSVVELMVEILEPYEGRIFDPFSGSGGMFVQSQKFIKSHGGDTDKISIYGQEIKESTLQISKMNLYLRGLDGSIKQGDSILNDQHKGLEADYVITNPPFNMSEWGKDSIADDDPRFEYGMPPSSNANYAFIQHMISHLDDDGMAATVMANGAMSVQGTEGDIRESIVEGDLLDAVIALPKELFFTTSIPACIFILSKGKDSDQYRNRSGETLFVDAREEYESIDRTQNVLEDEHISKVVEKVRAYRGEDGADEYEDEKGFCKVAEIEDIGDNRYIITPGRYVGVKEQDGDDEPFEVKMERLSADLRENFQRSDELQEEIEKNLEVLGF